jgi:hypothetical protein
MVFFDGISSGQKSVEVGKCKAWSLMSAYKFSRCFDRGSRYPRDWKNPSIPRFSGRALFICDRGQSPGYERDGTSQTRFLNFRNGQAEKGM